jgi:hypothetical protein
MAQVVQKLQDQSLGSHLVSIFAGCERRSTHQPRERVDEWEASKWTRGAEVVLWCSKVSIVEI